jgi:hypothetical protein
MPAKGGVGRAGADADKPSLLVVLESRKLLALQSLNPELGGTGNRGNNLAFRLGSLNVLANTVIAP